MISFVDWALLTLSSFQMQQFIVYCVFGIFGILAHYVKKYLNDEGSDSLSDHFFKYMVGDHPKRSVAMVLSFIGSGLAYVFSGATDGMTWVALIGLAFTTGYSLDSTVNKVRRPGEEPDQPEQAEGVCPTENKPKQ